MKLFSSKWRLAAVVVFLLLALFLLRPGASRLKSRIIYSISAGVGRPVDIGSVHVRLLPRPGFDLENLVVYDDAAFGAEPMLRAGEVTASLRLTSLLRGHMEIARLDLTEPSLNIVRAESGRWNLEMLLERAAHTPLAPTAKAKSEPRPGFPYIDASSARINFKNGPEKKAYALTNADFALWQDSENAWGVRLKAQPFRTDLNLSDTGTLQVNGSWQRAATMQDTPLQFEIEWNRAQLGQLTKFFTGNDQSWRGGVLVDMSFSGTPAKLAVASHASVEDFRRYDIPGTQPLRLAADCSAEYQSGDRTLHSLACSAPVGGGIITLKGQATAPIGQSYSLVLGAENVPASAAMALAMRMKKNLPPDLLAAGTIHGTFSVEKNATQIKFDGRGEIAQLKLSSATEKAETAPVTIPLVLSTAPAYSGLGQGHKNLLHVPVPQGPHLEFGTAPSPSHPTGPAVLGWATRREYAVFVNGETDIARTLRTMRLFGFPAWQSAAEGTAQLDLQISGRLLGEPVTASQGFSAPQFFGTARLKNARLAVRGTGAPVEVSSADIQFSGSEIRVDRLMAKAAGAVWTGSLHMPRGCPSTPDCPVQFDLNADKIAPGLLREWMNPRVKDKPWYRMLAPANPAGPNFLGELQASGHITAGRLQIQAVVATHVSADVRLDAGKLHLENVAADFMAGKHRGDWQANFSVNPASCRGEGKFIAVSLGQIADAMNDRWISGVGDAGYQIKGTCLADFWNSAEGTLQFEMRDGTIPRISLGADAGPLKVTRLAGHATLRMGKIEVKDAKLESPSGTLPVSGSASLARELNLKIGTVPGYAITGTLAEPKVSSLAGSETQAKLKAQP